MTKLDLGKFKNYNLIKIEWLEILQAADATEDTLKGKHLGYKPTSPLLTRTLRAKRDFIDIMSKEVRVFYFTEGIKNLLYHTKNEIFPRILPYDHLFIEADINFHDIEIHGLLISIVITDEALIKKYSEPFTYPDNKYLSPIEIEDGDCDGLHRMDKAIIKTDDWGCEQYSKIVILASALRERGMTAEEFTEAIRNKTYGLRINYRATDRAGKRATRIEKRLSEHDTEEKFTFDDQVEIFFEDSVPRIRQFERAFEQLGVNRFDFEYKNCSKCEECEGKKLIELKDAVINRDYYYKNRRLKKIKNGIQAMVCNFLDTLHHPDVIVVPIAENSTRNKNRARRGKAPIPAHHFIKITGELRRYVDRLRNLSEEKLSYGYSFWVRGHFRRYWDKNRYRTLYQKFEDGKAPGYYLDPNNDVVMRYILPQIRGEGILVTSHYAMEKKNGTTEGT